MVHSIEPQIAAVFTINFFYLFIQKIIDRLYIKNSLIIKILFRKSYIVYGVLVNNTQVF